MPLGRKPLGVGIDVLSWKRTQRFLTSHSFPFIDRLLAPSEQSLLKNARDPVSLFARFFTAKEAAIKAFGDSWADVDRFRQIEIVLEDQNRFTVGAPFCEAEGNFFETPNGIGAQMILWSVVGRGNPAPAVSK